MRKTSCGILILNDRSELLLCHATGTYHWDIPKGGMHADETPLQTAIRETEEESGLEFAAGQLLDLGHFVYRPGKDLHLFAARGDQVDPGHCHCRSHYRDRWGRSRPEMDDFAWVAFDRVHRHCARHMAALLTQTISLPGLLAKLTPAPPGSA